MSKTSHDSSPEKYSETQIDEATARVVVDPAEEKRILRKIDVHLLPFVTVLYVQGQTVDTLGS